MIRSTTRSGRPIKPTQQMDVQEKDIELNKLKLEKEILQIQIEITATENKLNEQSRNTQRSQCRVLFTQPQSAAHVTPVPIIQAATPANHPPQVSQLHELSSLPVPVTQSTPVTQDTPFNEISLAQLYNKMNLPRLEPEVYFWEYDRLPIVAELL